MPWNVKPTGGKFCVVKSDTGETVKCHNTKQSAQQHVKALYANVDEVVEKMMLEILEENILSDIHISKEADGRYRIVVVSTAQIADRENETFTTVAMDKEILRSSTSGVYPEFRLFHTPILGIGNVEKMYRVGIFAIDEGHSYDDPFSLHVCKELLAKNDGRWRASRGFYAKHVAAGCPKCGTELSLKSQHMVVGFRCPGCDQVHLSFKGMQNVRYLDTHTFDVTITDVPAVPMTSAAAFPLQAIDKESSMNKSHLKERLLAAGLDEGLVDAKLNSVTDEQLKEWDDIPMAQVLKEFNGETDAETVEEVYLDQTAMDAIAGAVSKELQGGFIDTLVGEIAATFQGMEIEIDQPVTKEYGDRLTAIEESLLQIKEAVGRLMQSDDERLKELNTPGARNRIRLFSVAKEGGKKKMPMDDDEEEEDDEEYETQNGTKIDKQTARWLKPATKVNENDTEEVIVGADGSQYKSMTEMVSGR